MERHLLKCPERLAIMGRQSNKATGFLTSGSQNWNHIIILDRFHKTTSCFAGLIVCLSVKTLTLKQITGGFYCEP